MRSRTYIINVPDDRGRIGFGALFLIVLLIGAIAFFAGAVFSATSVNEKPAIEQQAY